MSLKFPWVWNKWDFTSDSPDLLREKLRVNIVKC